MSAVDFELRASNAIQLIEQIYLHNPVAASTYQVKWNSMAASDIRLFEEDKPSTRQHIDDILLMWKNFAADFYESLFKYGYALVALRRCTVADHPGKVRQPVVVPPHLYYVVSNEEWTTVMQKKRPFPMRTPTENYRGIFFDKKYEDYYKSRESGYPIVFCTKAPIGGVPTSSLIRLYDMHQKYVEHMEFAAAVASRNAYPQGYYITGDPDYHKGGVNPGEPRPPAQQAMITHPLNQPDDLNRLTERLRREQQAARDDTDQLRAQIIRAVNQSAVAPTPETMRSHIGRSSVPGDYMHSTLYPAGPNVTKIEFIPQARELSELVDNQNMLAQRMCTIVGIPPTMLNIPMQSQRSGQRDEVTMETWRCQMLADLNFMNSCLSVIGQQIIYNVHWKWTCKELDIDYKNRTYVQLTTPITLADTVLLAPHFTALGMQATLATITQLPRTYFRDKTPPPTPAAKPGFNSAAKPVAKPAAKRKKSETSSSSAKKKPKTST